MPTGKKLVTVLAFAAIMTGFLPSPSSAQSFDPNNVITDRTIRDSKAMDFWQIQSFLAQKGGLGNRFDIDPNDGLLKGAAQLISDAAERHGVNPKYILALIQKESSAVESANPTPGQLDFATGYGVCDSCAKNDPSALKNKGLAKQIDAGAGFVGWFWNEGISWGSLPKPGQPKAIDGLTVTPANTATAAMYAYTPHLHGNRLLVSIWNRWWGEGTEGTTSIPDGSLVRNEKTGQIGLVRSGRLRIITSPTVLRNRFGAIVPIGVNEYDFAALAVNSGPPIRLVEPSLVRTEEDGATWLLVHGKKRRIASPEAFIRIGFNPEEVENVTVDDISDYAEGPVLTATSGTAVGYLAQDPRSGGWWWVENDERHALLDPALLSLAFYNQPRRQLSSASIDLLTLGTPARFPDGSLLKSAGDPKVYVISEGKRRPIASEMAFVSLGYRWTDIRTVSGPALTLHEPGEAVDITRDGNL